MNRETALEIIAAYGGDAARWPATEAAALLALAAVDAEVAAALADARRFDVLLGGWAIAPVAIDIDIATITRLPVVAPVRKRRWIAGGLAAAALAAGIAVLAPMTSSADRAVVAVVKPAATLAAADPEQQRSEADAFANVFTPTASEDSLI